MVKIFPYLLTLAFAFAPKVGITADPDTSASITVIKTTQGGDDTFQFVGSGPNGFDFGNGFTVSTTNGTSDPGNNAVFAELELGSYSLVEITAAGWDLNSASCSGDDDGSDPASIILDLGEHLVCTFHNIKRGTIEVVKEITSWTGLSPKPPSKTFTFDAGGQFFFDGVGGVSTQVTLTPLDESTVSTTGPIEVIPGLSYSVTEQDPTGIGWLLLNASCDNGSSPSAIDVAPGEAVVCTFTNAPLGSATVVVNSVGGSGLFGFTWENFVPENSLAEFDLDTTGDGTEAISFSYKLLPSYAYDLTQTSVPANVGDYEKFWVLSNVGCQDPTQDSTVSNGPYDASIIAVSAETVVCTFTNTLAGTLIVRKETIPDGVDVAFDFTGDTGLTGSVRDYSAFAEELFRTGQPATYGTVESVPDGWTVSNIACMGANSSTVRIGRDGVFTAPGWNEGDDEIEVDLAAGETVICTFTNTELPPERLIFEDGFEL